MDVFSLYSYGKRCASKWLILCIIFSCADTEIYFRRLLPKRKVIWQMNHTAMNKSIWTTNSQSLSYFEFSHFCRYFPFLFDSCRHILLNICVCHIGCTAFRLPCLKYAVTYLQGFKRVSIGLTVNLQMVKEVTVNPQKWKNFNLQPSIKLGIISSSSLRRRHSDNNRRAAHSAGYLGASQLFHAQFITLLPSFKGNHQPSKMKKI